MLYRNFLAMETEELLRAEPQLAQTMGQMKDALARMEAEGDMKIID